MARVPPGRRSRHISPTNAAMSAAKNTPKTRTTASNEPLSSPAAVASHSRNEAFLRPRFAARRLASANNGRQGRGRARSRSDRPPARRGARTPPRHSTVEHLVATGEQESRHRRGSPAVPEAKRRTQVVVSRRGVRPRGTRRMLTLELPGYRLHRSRPHVDVLIDPMVAWSPAFVRRRAFDHWQSPCVARRVSRKAKAPETGCDPVPSTDARRTAGRRPLAMQLRPPAVQSPKFECWASGRCVSQTVAIV